MSIVEKDGEILPAYNPDGNGNQPYYPRGGNKDTEMPHGEFEPSPTTAPENKRAISPSIERQLPTDEQRRIGSAAIAAMRDQGILPPRKH